MKKILFILILNFCLLTNFVNFSFAQNSAGLKYNLVSGDSAGVPNPFPIVKATDDTGGGNSMSRVLGYAFDMIIGISIALAVIIFMVGAFGNIFGETSIGSIKANKDMMKNAVGGLIITLSFYLILQTINPDLVKFPLFANLDIAGLRSNAATTPNAAITSPGQ